MRRKTIIYCLAVMTGLCMKASAQAPSSEPVQMYLIHSSGNHLVMASDNVARLESPTASNKRPLLFIPDGKGYFSIQANSSTPLFLSLSGSWNTAFIADSASDNAKYAIEQASSKLYRLRCKANNRYLGTDANTPNLPTPRLSIPSAPRWCASTSTDGASRSAGGQTCAATGTMKVLTR